MPDFVANSSFLVPFLACKLRPVCARGFRGLVESDAPRREWRLGMKRRKDFLEAQMVQVGVIPTLNLTESQRAGKFEARWLHHATIYLCL